MEKPLHHTGDTKPCVTGGRRPAGPSGPQVPGARGSHSSVLPTWGAAALATDFTNEPPQARGGNALAEDAQAA